MGACPEAVITASRECDLGYESLCSTGTGNVCVCVCVCVRGVCVSLSVSVCGCVCGVGVVLSLCARLSVSHFPPTSHITAIVLFRIWPSTKGFFLCNRKPWL